jgi:hypothetical protein
MIITKICGINKRIVILGANELESAREVCPCLLDQANGYGSNLNEKTGSCVLGPMPVLMANNMVSALEKARTVHRG